MPGVTRFRFARYRSFILALAACLGATELGLAGDGGVSAATPAAPPYILIGFVGGFVRHDNLHQGPVQFAQRARRVLPRNSYIEVFENRHRKAAYKTILHLLDRNHDGVLSEEEKSQTHIILYGHSWGASAAVLLARELDRINIPVMLTVQVDSVTKPWQHDEVIPDNVAAAVNFYQPHGLIHGRSKIRAADVSKTEILGNYRYDYRETPVKCEGMSWFDRAFMHDHMQSQCDPRIWTQVEAFVVYQTDPGTDSVAAISRP